MGCDAYADENGVVVIEICSYDDPSNPPQERGAST